jgi:hypothetical protein
MILLLLVLSVGASSCSEHVSLIELHHFYDAKGKLVFEQVIFWDRNVTSGLPEVRAWRMVADNEQYNRRPVKSEATGLWCCEWFEFGRRYRIVAKQYKESWSQVDPEQLDRKRLPEDERKALNSGRPVVLEK